MSKFWNLFVGGSSKLEGVSPNKEPQGETMLLVTKQCSLWLLVVAVRTAACVLVRQKTVRCNMVFFLGSGLQVRLGEGSFLSLLFSKLQSLFPSHAFEHGWIESKTDNQKRSWYKFAHEEEKKMFEERNSCIATFSPFSVSTYESHYAITLVCTKHDASKFNTHFWICYFSKLSIFLDSTKSYDLLRVWYNLFGVHCWVLQWLVIGIYILKYVFIYDNMTKFEIHNSYIISISCMLYRLLYLEQNIVYIWTKL